MKSYKEFIKESTSSIESICSFYGITNYTINTDGSIDVGGYVNLIGTYLTKLPLKFRNVSGLFYCGHNELTTLDGAPESVGGSFDCTYNQLTTLEGSPQSASDMFNCSHNQLTTLRGCPQIIGRGFYCNNNQLFDFNGFPEDFDGYFHCINNPVFEIYNLFKTVKCIYWLNELDVIRGNKVVLDRLEDVYVELGMKIPKNIQLSNYEII